MSSLCAFEKNYIFITIFPNFTAERCELGCNVLLTSCHTEQLKVFSLKDMLVNLKALMITFNLLISLEPLSQTEKVKGLTVFFFFNIPHEVKRPLCPELFFFIKVNLSANLYVFTLYTLLIDVFSI